MVALHQRYNFLLIIVCSEDVDLRLFEFVTLTFQVAEKVAKATAESQN